MHVSTKSKFFTKRKFFKFFVKNFFRKCEKKRSFVQIFHIYQIHSQRQISAFAQCLISDFKQKDLDEEINQCVNRMEGIYAYHQKE